MNIFKLSIKNMASRPLSTLLSLILLTLGVGMISLLVQANRHIQVQMSNNVRGIDMVVGAKGSPLQLILSAIYHVDNPTGNISMAEADRLSRNRLVAYGIPLSYGDAYEGYRIVGTDHQYPEIYQTNLENGRLWEESMEVTVGATVASTLGLEVGMNFTGSHGLAEEGMDHEEHVYTIVGILEYSNSVIDQLILTSLESVWHVHSHSDEDESTEEKDITAMLIKFRSPMGMVQLPRMVNENTNMQAAIPSYEINRLFSLMGVGIDTLSAIALLIIIVSGLSVFISLYNALKDRLYEMALMRTYGATRLQLMWLVIQEGLILAILGFLSGMILSRIGLMAVSTLLESTYSYKFSGIGLIKQEWWLFLIAIVIGLLASIIPAIRVFNINISKTLANI